MIGLKEIFNKHKRWRKNWWRTSDKQVESATGKRTFLASYHRTTWSHTNPTGHGLDRVISTSACLHHRWTYISTLGVANGFHSHRLNSNLCTLNCIESYQVLTHASLRSGFHHLTAPLTILPRWRWRVFGKWEWSKVIRWGAPTLFHLTIVTPSTLIT